MADATEEQVKAANEAELARWEDDFPAEDLNVPANKEDQDAKGTDEEAEEATEDAAADDEPVEVIAPEPVITAEDPGEYVPADYSFEVTDKDGKTVKISTPEEADKFADDDENFQTARDLKNFLSKAGKMETKLDRDKEKWEDKKTAYDTQVATENERIESVNTLAKGIEYLVSKGFIPAVAKEDLTADWSDPEVAKHDGVKEQIALVNYMVKENEQRTRAGIPLLTSALDAYNAWQLDSGRRQEAAEHKAAGEARRAAGARVAGVAPSNQTPYVPKGISVGRVIPMRGSANWED